VRIFVGNLNFGAEEQDVQEFFESLGFAPLKIEMPTDRESGKRRGFAFVELADLDTANAAIDAANGQDFMGRTLNVNEARPREDHRSATRGRR